MKTKKNKIYVNNLFNNLIFENKLTILIIFLITIGLSFFYNNNIKNNEFYYSIKVFSNSPGASNNESLFSQNDTFYNFNSLINFNLIGMKYFSLFTDIRERDVTVDEAGNYYLSFKSNKKIDVKNFIEFINKSHKEILLNNLRKEIVKLNKKIEISKIQRNKVKEALVEIFDKLDENLYSGNEYILSKILTTLNDTVSDFNKNEVTESNLKLIEFYTKNFSTFFFEDYYFSLNGWDVKDNIYNNTEKTFAGLLFGFLLNSIFLFFRSNYFRLFYNFF